VGRPAAEGAQQRPLQPGIEIGKGFTPVADHPGGLGLQDLAPDFHRAGVEQALMIGLCCHFLRISLST